jgi:hypothetical protein
MAEGAWGSIMQNKWAADILGTGSWEVVRKKEEIDCKDRGGS